MFFEIDPRPSFACVNSTVDAASDLTVLICVAHKYFINVSGIDQDAGEVTERQIAAATAPTLAIIMGRIECLLRSNVNMIRAFRVLNHCIYRCFSGNSLDLVPSLTAVTRDNNTRGSSTRTNDFGTLQTGRIRGWAGRWTERRVGKVT